MSFDAKVKKKLTVRSKAIKEGILTHQVDEGSPCLKCGDNCIGFSLHFWRKTCTNCLCPRDYHQIRHDDYKEVQVGKLLFRGDDSPTASPYSRRRTSSMDSQSQTPPPSPGVMKKLNTYVWKPKNISDSMAVKYMGALPMEKCPIKDTPGEKYRQYQYVRQLPAHDVDINHCNCLSQMEQDEFSVFSHVRKEDALGRGLLKKSTQNGSKCAECLRQVSVGDVVVRASRAKSDDMWHPGCFTCSECKELLVDLIYFYHEGKLLCGRHHAEQLLPRCAACDEIIFCVEYTVAEGKNWHLAHFCCLRDDEPLGGKRYMMHEDQPFCIKCFDITHAPKCETCKRLISVDDQRLSHEAHSWHGVPNCFKCFNCSVSLIEKPFLPKGGKIFCCKQCYKESRGHK